ncbi:MULTISPECIES: TM0106 family RecB-like putative nuclease [unclassified Sphingobacterium]|uniref:TM0106 family RecB-like putative nuclease n=1 Tax=unclassified Sphingobacterium TaxID=2609468 RepID=UPI001050279B|nr:MULTISPECIES: TM0106 family RecB-like putative nuclease [unclassified Sphingobacterium]MCS3557401.1 uncharacterized protein [Sphingobacterium sp. JUb21]TCQ96698.1 uncharacterized protein EDF66_12140 [Sphingobacterium sp. JUb20]
MRKANNQIIYSATDLSNHIHCKNLTNLNLDVINGLLEKPNYSNRSLDLLRERGLSFEEEYLESLKKEGYHIFKVNLESDHPLQQTLEAMKEGYDFIYQARLSNEKWQGWADFLRKVKQPSNLGDWSYEVIDTKLTTNTRSGSIIQITLYSELLGDIQGIMPEHMTIKNPEEEHNYRVNDYNAYLRLIKKRLESAVAVPQETYPEPCMHCNVCNWWEHCNKIRRNDDHLGFIAGMGTSQIKEMRKQGVNTLEAMSTVSLPIPFTPTKGSKETFKKLREQARIQNESRTENRPKYELLELQNNSGLANLPTPTEGDIYLDFEGDPLIDPNGLEYLFGWVFQNTYYSIWVNNEEDEKNAFCQFVDFVFEQKERFPDLHIYHFSPYENVALKRLMSKYAVKENEIDTLLRSAVLIDLHRILRQSIRAGVEKYSLKDLEPYHGYIREMDLRTVSKIKADYEFLLESGNLKHITENMTNAIRLYNQDDCFSTLNLHQWLERERALLIDNGYEILRPIVEVKEPESVTQHLERITPIINYLLTDIPADITVRSKEQQAKYLLAHLLDWYRREEKSFWWEYFRLLALELDELLDEKDAIAMLDYTGEREQVKRSFIDTYTFPLQELDLKAGVKVNDINKISIGEIVEINEQNQMFRVKKTAKALDVHPDCIIKFEKISNAAKAENIIQFGEWIVENGFDSGSNDYRVTRDILLNRSPRLLQKLPDINDTVEKGKQWALNLDNSILPIQGPPGAGKSYTASHIIFDLIQKGKKVGITALSHKVIMNLLEKVKEVADEHQFDLKALYKGAVEHDDDKFWNFAKDNNVIISELSNYPLIAGTSFMWCKEELKDSLDYLFIDEAGQFALIETLVVSHAAKNIVFLGDHQQLSQPIKGVHPDGTDVSALEHLLEGEKTISEDKGLFLETTWRMHPEICDFDSEMFYESRLQSKQELKNQSIKGNTEFIGAGLFYKAVPHEGNTNSSLEEVTCIKNIVEELTKGDVYWTDKNSEDHVLENKHIKIITPYNSNVHELQKVIPEIEIGTVDKFQGQEAPIVIYSVASSSTEDAPRGMDFLYSPNRFNVAVSRAQIAFILVSNPLIFEADCKSPSEMKLANPYCRYIELSKMK